MSNLSNVVRLPSLHTSRAQDALPAAPAPPVPQAALIQQGINGANAAQAKPRSAKPCLASKKALSAPTPACAQGLTFPLTSKTLNKAFAALQPERVLVDRLAQGAEGVLEGSWSLAELKRHFDAIGFAPLDDKNLVFINEKQDVALYLQSIGGQQESCAWPTYYVEVRARLPEAQATQARHEAEHSSSALAPDQPGANFDTDLVGLEHTAMSLQCLHLQMAVLRGEIAKAATLAHASLQQDSKNLQDWKKHMQQLAAQLGQLLD